ncbi:MAG TPA: response regulator [Pirellulales bacterium]|jgi:FixJ family two-component response regulator|nr:response regulator [Pirellulales bacterium]
MHRSTPLADVSTVFVIDPELSTPALVNDLLDGFGMRLEAYGTCREFLAVYDAARPGCLVLEQRIPDMSGMQLQRRLAASGATLPLVFVIADASVSTAVELMRGGAVSVLEKPIRPLELFTAIQEALALDHDRRCTQTNRAEIGSLVAALTKKEREVLKLIAQGKSVKSMAAQLELTIRAIEQRRQSLMRKLRLDSPVALMRFSITAQRLFQPEAPIGRGTDVAGHANGHRHANGGVFDLDGSRNLQTRDSLSANGVSNGRDSAGRDRDFAGLTAALSAAVNHGSRPLPR